MRFYYLHVLSLNNIPLFCLCWTFFHYDYFSSIIKSKWGLRYFPTRMAGRLLHPHKTVWVIKPSHVYFSQRQQCCKGGGTTLRRVIWNCGERSSDASTSCFLQHLLIKVTGVSRKGKSPAQITVQFLLRWNNNLIILFDN